MRPELVNIYGCRILGNGDKGYLKGLPEIGPFWPLSASRRNLNAPLEGFMHPKVASNNLKNLIFFELQINHHCMIDVPSPQILLHA